MLAWRKPLVLAHSPLYTTSCHLEPWICKFSDVTLLGFSLNLPSRKTTPENGWLEDDPFLFGILPIFRGKLSSFSGLWMLVPTPLVCFHLFSLVFLKPCRIMRSHGSVLFSDGLLTENWNKWPHRQQTGWICMQCDKRGELKVRYVRVTSTCGILFCVCLLSLRNCFFSLANKRATFCWLIFCSFFFNLLARHGNAKAKFQTIRLTLTLTCLCEPDDFLNSNGMPFETMIWSNIFS